MSGPELARHVVRTELLPSGQRARVARRLPTSCAGVRAFGACELRPRYVVAVPDPNRPAGDRWLGACGVHLAQVVKRWLAAGAVTVRLFPRRPGPTR